jgi:tetratricopeptide (TPR) repeat protein
VAWGGLLMLLLLGMGWTKPLRLDPDAYPRPNRAIVLIALAGPLASGVLSLALYLVSLLSLGLALWSAPPDALRGPLFRFYAGTGLPPAVSLVAGALTFHAAQANLVLALINCVPLPPFDMFWALYAIARRLTAGRAAQGRRAVSPVPARRGGIGALFHEGAQLQGGRKWAQAREVYQRVLAADPRHREAAYSLGQVCVGLGDRFEAARAFGRAYALSAADDEREQAVERLRELGVSLIDALAAQPPELRVPLPAAAADAAAVVPAVAPAVAPASAPAGLLVDVPVDVPGALLRPAVATPARAVSGPPLRPRLALRGALLGLGLFIVLASLYFGAFPATAVQALSAEPFLARLADAEAALAADRPAEAEQALSEALELAGEVYAQAPSEPARADAAVRVRALARRLPGSRPAGVLLALVELDAGHPETARAVLTELSNPHDYHVQLYLASAWLERDKWDEAEEALAEAVRLRPNDPVAHNNLAFVYYQRGEYGRARDEARQAVALDQFFAHAWKNWALSELEPAEERELDVAFLYALIATHYGPGLASAHEVWSRTLSAYGQTDLAEQERRAAKQLQTEQYGQYSPYY